MCVKMRNYALLFKTSQTTLICSKICGLHLNKNTFPIRFHILVFKIQSVHFYRVKTSWVGL